MTLRNADKARKITETSSYQRRHQGRRVAIIISGPGTGETGGAERFYAGLVKAFRQIGCVADLIPTEAHEPDVETIISNFQQASEIDLSEYDFVISTKVPSYAVKHPRHIVYLVHTVRVFDDMFNDRFPTANRHDRINRAKVHHADFEALRRAKAIFAIGHEVADRLYRWRGLSAEVLHPPLGVSGFRSQPAEDFFFIPGRLHPWKRLDLLVAAVKASRLDLRVKIAGTGEQEAQLRKLIGTDHRIEMMGRISDSDLIEQYSRCLAVPFLTMREDYGYVTLEAFASAKPVITCEDSGEPSRIVVHGQSGLVVPPTVEAVRDALEQLWTDQNAAALMGEAGREVIAGFDWKQIALRLADAAFAAGPSKTTTNIAITVTDIQPIDPPVGGGRLRLLGLYHGMGHNIQCTYVGTYDWPGEQRRDHSLSVSLREINIPLSDAHHRAAQSFMEDSDGLNAIDLLFSKQAHLSPEFIGEVVNYIRRAKIIIFSHPWVYPLVAREVRANQTVIYDSQNVEGYLRAQLLDRYHPLQLTALRNVIGDELALVRRADWILACSHEDLLRFHSLYGISPERMRVVPNGVMAFQAEPASQEQRRKARERLCLPPEGFFGVFIGSPYGPNVDAARFLADVLAPADPSTHYVIAGGVGEAVVSKSSNLHITGPLREDEKALWFAASDFAINPMMSGSGTNIKMFDFMAAGLPVVTTEIGARGIDPAGADFMICADATIEAMKQAVSRLRGHPDRLSLSRAARARVEEDFAWERISHQLGAFCANRHRMSGQPKPHFSVVVPTYERHQKLGQIFEALQSQLERDFEVIVVDQSSCPWEQASLNFGFPFFYYHSPVKGAARARNSGAMIAQGQIIAFVDDDCIPDADWLLNARAYFADANVAGIEGLIYSDHLDDPDWRPVTNVGFEGIGFMTANLLVRSAAFQYLGGFDLQFDKPHFREDTDFGWRLQGLGQVPYAADVRVFHPAQPRQIQRESLAERTRFFRNDAKLFAKHPERYRELFFRECQFIHNPEFIPTLIQGFRDIGYSDEHIPEWIRDKR
jgi:glycosyltransferase involved in cell wall biosynthesis/GT2 family glycosyltransferase